MKRQRNGNSMLRSSRLMHTFLLSKNISLKTCPASPKCEGITSHVVLLLSDISKTQYQWRVGGIHRQYLVLRYQVLRLWPVLVLALVLKIPSSQVLVLVLVLTNWFSRLIGIGIGIDLKRHSSPNLQQIPKRDLYTLIVCFKLSKAKVHK